MKILVIAPTPFFADRGCHIRIYREIRYLQARGHQVEVFTYHLGDDLPGLKIHRTIKIPWYRKLGPGPSYHKFYMDVLLLIKALRIIPKIKPDIIHSHLHEGAIIGKICSWVFKIPMVFDVQGSLVGELKAHKFIRKDSFLGKILLCIERWTYHTVHILFVNTNYTAEKLVRGFSLNQKSIFVVPDAAIDVTPITLFNLSLQKKLDLGIPLDKKVVVYLGVLGKHQGTDFLLQVIQYVLKKRNDIHFLIMGYPDEEKYIDLSQKYNIHQHITFLGRIPFNQRWEYLALGDIAVSPKFMDGGEGNGKLYDYLAAGLPTIVFDHPVNREILGDRGVYAKPADIISFGNCLLRLVGEEKFYQKMRNRIRALQFKEYISGRNSFFTLEQVIKFASRKYRNSCSDTSLKEVLSL
jgi:glycosyltransferase involved in cell wall biosynthesis